MAPLLLGDPGFLRSTVPVAEGFAVESGQLDDEVAEVVPVVTSSTGRTPFIFAPFEIVPVSFVAASVATSPHVAPVASSADIATVAASADVAPDAPSADVAHDTASADFVLVTAPITFSSALAPPVPVLSTFSSSLLVLSASAPRSLNTPAFAVVPDVAIQRLLNCLARCNAEYVGLENCFVAREVHVKLLTAEIQSLIVQVTVLCNQYAQQQ